MNELIRYIHFQLFSSGFSLEMSDKKTFKYIEKLICYAIFMSIKFSN